MKTAITANSVHLRWWKLLRMVLSIEGLRVPKERTRDYSSPFPNPAGPRGSNVSQARDFLRDARESFSATRYEEAYRLAVESQSYSRRTLGGSGGGENGDASFIFVEGDVSLQRAGRSTFEPAKQRQPLFDGDFVKAGKTGSAEIMFFDGTLYTIRPGSLFECRRPVSSEVAGS